MLNSISGECISLLLDNDYLNTVNFLYMDEIAEKSF